ncbi:MAG: Holliday junction branch migration protein RuvA [Clostridiales bacterium]|nr:Holliday junction branch migration protein RuvA [Clostridiales bacterium]
MYAHIRGVVSQIMQDRVVIDACGIGYELFCSAETRKHLAVGKEHKLLTHFHIALSQDVMSLYGFETEEERAMFRRLIGVTRVGPKLALSVLSVLTVSDIAGAILTENAAAFDKVPGMGRKTAARVLLELKEKIGKDEMVSVGLPEAAATGIDIRTEAIAALVSLGYDGVTAGRAVAAVGECSKVEDMITQALRELARKG